MEVERGTPRLRRIGGAPWNGSLTLFCPVPKGEHEKHLSWRAWFDFEWVCATFITILGKEQNRRIPFKLNDAQRWVLWNILDMESQGLPVKLWILKGRQFGVSTFFAIRLFIKAALCGQNCLLLAHREKEGKTMFGKLELALKSLPQLSTSEGRPFKLAPKPTTHITGDLLRWVTKTFNATLRRESAENRDAGVSETYQHVQLTEVPLYADADYTLAGLLPTIPNAFDTTVVGEFTARGEGDYTHRTWQRSVRGEGIFRAIFLAWYWHKDYRRERRETDYPLTPEELGFAEMLKVKGFEYPLTPGGDLIPRLREKWLAGRPIMIDDLRTGFAVTEEQLLWRRDMIDSFAGDMDKWRREFPSTPEEAFSAAGRRLIPPGVMDVMDTHMQQPLDGDKGRGEYISTIASGGKGRARWQPRPDGRCWRWKLPERESVYVVDVDPSSGSGPDPTGIHVLKVTYQRIEVVASWSGWERPHEVARIAARLGRHYRDDVPETGEARGKGRPCEIVVEANGFGDHVIHELTDNLRYRRIWRYTDKGKDNYSRGHVYGFPTTRFTKMPMLQHLVQLCFDNKLVVPCSRTLGELRSLQYLDDDDKTAGAPKGSRDDLAMAFGIGVWAASEKPAYKSKPKEKIPKWLKDRLVFHDAGH